MAVGTVIYGISGDAVSRIRNTHGDSTSRPAAGPVISGTFGDAVIEIGDTHGDSTFWPARLILGNNEGAGFLRTSIVSRLAPFAISAATNGTARLILGKHEGMWFVRTSYRAPAWHQSHLGN